MIRIAHWEIDPQDRTVTNTKSGNAHTTEPKTMSVLLLLIERDGQVVSRDEFMQIVWSGRFTVEESLTRCISELRKIFGDSPKNPQYIKTIHGRGYQLLVKATSSSTQSNKGANVNNEKSQGAYITIACMMIFALVAWWIYVALVPFQKEVVAEANPVTVEASALTKNIAEDVLSINGFPSKIVLSPGANENEFEIIIDKAQQNASDNNIVNIQINDSDGLVVWQGIRNFDTRSDRILMAEDLSQILVKIDSSKKAPEFVKLPADLQVQYQHAIYLINRRGQDNLNDAIEILDRILSQRSDFVMAFIQQAVAIRSLSLYETNIEERQKFLTRYELLLKQAKAIAPDHPVTMAVSYNFNVTEASLAEYEQVLKAAVEYAPACVICVRELAEFYLHIGYFEKAAKLVEKHLDYFPLSILMHSYLAIIYSHQGNIELTYSQAQVVESLGENRGFDALSLKVQVAMMKGDTSAYLGLREELLEQHPVYLQHAQVIDALMAMNTEEAKAIIRNMPFLDFNLALSAGMFEELLVRINNNLSNGQIRDFKFIHGYLNPESYLVYEYSVNLLNFKNSEEVLNLFTDVGMLTYWQENRQWPDYCHFIEYHKQRPSYCP
ncbi:winged helix-turn-helix domain-containing protein [Glaciecola sp. SC05]|uniref:winged helix-turn-helix domain-containing protein n=1 Tax=Glaciecola sp. SC05 TaxID=1987355 RepID=UPI003526D554